MNQNINAENTDWGIFTLQEAAESALRGDTELLGFVENVVKMPDRLCMMTGYDHQECEVVCLAANVAEELHHGQYRKGTDTPYILHPFGVAAILLREGCAPDMVVAGLLHDTLEDTAYERDELKERFGDNVAAIVEGCSEPFKDRPWRERKEHTINYLQTAPWQVRLVTCADKLHNIISIAKDYGVSGDDLWKRFKVGKEGQAWYYRSLVNSLSSADFMELRMYRELRCQVEQIFSE